MPTITNVIIDLIDPLKSSGLVGIGCGGARGSRIVAWTTIMANVTFPTTTGILSMS